MQNTIDTILFDLDGTLVDTLPDLAAALNAVLLQHAYAKVSPQALRASVSHGARAMLAEAFNLLEQPIPDDFDLLHQQMLANYAAAVADESRLFVGMEQVLQFLAEKQLKWGIVTNKYQSFTTPLVNKLGLASQAVCVVSGDTLAEKKPHPAPLLYACSIANTPVQNCVYIGDAQRDIQAGIAAGMRTLVAAFGYVAPSENLADWGADGILYSPQDLITWLH